MPATIKLAGWRAGLSALGLVLAMAPALAQTASKTTPEFIRAATAKVDGASIVANERATARLAELRPGLCRDALLAS